MKEILQSRLTIFSGWNCGLAILFVFFNKKVQLMPQYFCLLDNFLAVTTVLFFLVFTRAVTTGLVLLKNTEGASCDVDFGKAFRIVLLGATVGSCGVFFLGFAGAVYGETKTTVAIGASIAALGIMVAYAGVKQIFKRKV